MVSNGKPYGLVIRFSSVMGAILKVVTAVRCAQSQHGWDVCV